MPVDIIEKDLKLQWPGLGHQTRMLRHSISMSQEQLAQKLGCSWMTVHRWEQDQRGIRYSNLAKLCQLAGVEISSILPTSKQDQ